MEKSKVGKIEANLIIKLSMSNCLLNLFNHDNKKIEINLLYLLTFIFFLGLSLYLFQNPGKQDIIPMNNKDFPKQLFYFGTNGGHYENSTSITFKKTIAETLFGSIFKWNYYEICLKSNSTFTKNGIQIFQQQLPGYNLKSKNDEFVDGDLLVTIYPFRTNQILNEMGNLLDDQNKPFTKVINEREIRMHPERYSASDTIDKFYKYPEYWIRLEVGQHGKPICHLISSDELGFFYYPPAYMGGYSTSSRVTVNNDIYKVGADNQKFYIRVSPLEWLAKIIVTFFAISALFLPVIEIIKLIFKF